MSVLTKEKYLSVPYGKSVYGEEEINAVLEVLKTSTQMGKNVAAMEAAVAKLFAKQFGIMVNSGSSANYLAIELLKLPEGSEVITPALTFSTTVAPIVKNKLIPVFIDVEEGTYNINHNLIESMINKNTKALIIPSLLGNLPDWQKIKELADKYKLIVIEDSCDTLGATLNGKSSGVYSDISTTSFYGSHVITCAGNGGMLCINDPEIARRAKLLRSWGRSSSLFVDSENIENRFNVKLDDYDYDAKFLFEDLGYNIEPTEIGAAFGLVQLKKLNNNIAARHHWFNCQYNFFKQYQDWFILPKTNPNCSTGWLAFPLTIKANAPFSRRDLQIYLEKHGIQTRPIFSGNILRQPAFKEVSCIKNKDGYPIADAVTKGGILLACHHGLNNDMLSHIHQVFTDFIETL